MPVSAEQKLRAERVVATLREILAAAHATDIEWARRYRAGDEGAMDELIVRACAQAGVPYAEYHEAVERDAQLLELQKKSIAEVLLGPMKARPAE